MRTFSDSTRLCDVDSGASIYAVETRPLPPELSPGGGRRHSHGNSWIQCVVFNELQYDYRPSEKFVHLTAGSGVTRSGFWLSGEVIKVYPI